MAKDKDQLTLHERWESETDDPIFIIKRPDIRPKVKLIGEDGNAFNILGKVQKALKDAGASKEYIEEYVKEASAGDYNHLLSTTMKYVDVE